MITEDYVSFETAKLLKEKAFNEATYSFYHRDDGFLRAVHLEKRWSDEDVFISAPTHQMAAKWLREKYSLHIYITWDEDRGFQPNIINLKEDHIYQMEMYRGFTYEQIEEEAIQICLTEIIPTLNIEP